MAQTTQPADGVRQPPDKLPALKDRQPTEQDNRLLECVAKALLSRSADEIQAAARLLQRRAEIEAQAADLWARLPATDEPAE